MSRFLSRLKTRAASKPTAAPKSNADALALIETQRRQLAELQARSARDLAAITDKATKLERDLAAAAEERRLGRIRAEVLRAAKAAGAVDEDDVADLVMTRGRFVLADDGTVHLDGKPEVDATAHVAAFVEARPHLAAKRVAGGSGASPTPRAPDAARPPEVHDLRTRDGATTALRDALLKKIASPAAPTGADAGRGLRS